MLDRSLVILTSDHGEELFDHGGFEHGHALYDEVLRVPLVLWAPWITPGREPAPVSLIDLAPTMLQAAGLEPSPDLTGVSLPAQDGSSGDDDGRRPVVAEGLLYGPDTKTIIDWPFKAILELESGRVQLFNLDEDPAEEHDLASGGKMLGDMIQTLSGILVDARNNNGAAEVELDADLSRRLRSLGYVR